MDEKVIIILDSQTGQVKVRGLVDRQMIGHYLRILADELENTMVTRPIDVTYEADLLQLHRDWRS